MKSGESAKQRVASPGAFNLLVGFDSKSPATVKARQIAEAAKKGKKAAASAPASTTGAPDNSQAPPEKPRGKSVTTPRDLRGKSAEPEDLADFRNDFRLRFHREPAVANDCDSIFNPWPLAEAARVPPLERTQDQHERLRRLESRYQEACRSYTGPFRLLPYFQLGVARACLDSREKIAGDAAVMFDEVVNCARFGLVLPPWLVVEFLERVQLVRCGLVDNWNDPRALGPEHPQEAGAKRGMSNNLRNKRLHGERLYMACADILRDRSPNDQSKWPTLPDLRAAAAKRCGMGPVDKRSGKDGPDDRTIVEYIDAFLGQAPMYPSLRELSRGVRSGKSFEQIVSESNSMKVFGKMLSHAHGQTILLDDLPVVGVRAVADRMAPGGARGITHARTARGTSRARDSGAKSSATTKGNNR